jgi:hypothetical protein
MNSVGIRPLVCTQELPASRLTLVRLTRCYTTADRPWIHVNSIPRHKSSRGKTEVARIIFQALMDHSSMRPVRYP